MTRELCYSTPKILIFQGFVFLFINIYLVKGVCKGENFSNQPVHQVHLEDNQVDLEDNQVDLVYNQVDLVDTQVDVLDNQVDLVDIVI